MISSLLPVRNGSSIGVAAFAAVMLLLGSANAQQYRPYGYWPGAVVPPLPTPTPTPATPPSAATPTSSEYRAVLKAWLEGHKRYPEVAQQRGEQGAARLRFRVDRSGPVLDYAIISGTGYPDLDAAVEDMMRGATLPPFSPNMTQPEIDVTVTVRFGLTSQPALTRTPADTQGPTRNSGAGRDQTAAQRPFHALPPTPSSATAPAQVWSWCDPLRAYYPWVRSCPTPWRSLNLATAMPQFYGTPPARGAPTSVAPTLAQNSAAGYNQGVADWQALEAWFETQADDRRAGADLWAANRSIAGHKSCADAASAYQGDKGDFLGGCEDAKRRLGPIDRERLSDPQFRAGFADEAEKLAIAPASQAPKTPNQESMSAPPALGISSSTEPGGPSLPPCSNNHIAAALKDLQSASQQMTIVKASARAASQRLDIARKLARMQLGCTGSDGDCLLQTAGVVLQMSDKSTTSAWNLLMLVNTFDGLAGPPDHLGDRLKEAIEATTRYCQSVSGATSTEEERRQQKELTESKIAAARIRAWSRDDFVSQDVDSVLVGLQIVTHGTSPAIAPGRKDLDTIYSVSDSIKAAFDEVETAD